MLRHLHLLVLTWYHLSTKQRMLWNKQPRRRRCVVSPGCPHICRCRCRLAGARVTHQHDDQGQLVSLLYNLEISIPRQTVLAL